MRIFRISYEICSVVMTQSNQIWIYDKDTISAVNPVDSLIAVANKNVLILIDMDNTVKTVSNS